MTLASARLKASVRFPPLRGMYQRGGICKGCDMRLGFPLDGYLRGPVDVVVRLVTATVVVLP